MSSETVRYRIPNATFPLRFVLFGAEANLHLEQIVQGNFWACRISHRSALWHVIAAADEVRILAELRETGFAVTRASFVGTAFRELERIGYAERM